MLQKSFTKLVFQLYFHQKTKYYGGKFNRLSGRILFYEMPDGMKNSV